MQSQEQFMQAARMMQARIANIESRVRSCSLTRLQDVHIPPPSRCAGQVGRTPLQLQLPKPVSACDSMLLGSRVFASTQHRKQTPGKRTVGIASLQMRIFRSTLSELPQFIEHIAWLLKAEIISPADCNALCRTMVKRAECLLADVTLGSLGDATKSLRALMENLVILPLLGVDGPRQSLEARLTFLARDCGTEGLEALSRCLRCAQELYELDCSASSTRRHIVEQIVQWLEVAKVEQLENNMTTLYTLADAETSLCDAISERLRFHATNIQAGDLGELQRVARILLRAPHKSALACERMEDLALSSLSASIAVCPLDVLAEEMSSDGTLVELCAGCGKLRRALRLPLSQRLVRGIVEASDSFSREPMAMQQRQSLEFWGWLAQAAKAHDLIVLDTVARSDLVRSIAKCRTSDLGICDDVLEELELAVEGLLAN